MAKKKISKTARKALAHVSKATGIPVLVRKTGERIMGKADAIFDQLDKLETLKQEAIDELLERRNEIDEKLKRLGYLDTPRSTPRKQREKKDEPCSICKFKTEPLHDARKHRSQGDNKKPFTHDELVKLGLKKAS